MDRDAIVRTLRDMPPGMIGFAAGDQGRFTDFAVNLVALWKPAGTQLKRATGLGPAAPFNEVGRAFMANPDLEWLFLTNDDNLCPPDTIPRLWGAGVPCPNCQLYAATPGAGVCTCGGIGKVGTDAITGLYFGRIQPFEPILFDAILEAEAVDPGLGVRTVSSRWYRRKFMQPGESGIMPITACGDGCLMITRKVMEAIPQPWWEYGETVTDACDHDMVFSRKIQEAGFQLYCDTDLWVDHMGHFAIRPNRDEAGNWTVQLVQGMGRTIAVPAPRFRKGEGE